MRMKHIIASLFSLTGLTGLLRFTNRLFRPGRALVLMYHRLREDGVREEPFYSEVFGPSVTSFERQMRFLRRCHNVISLDRLLASLKGKDRLPPNAVAITFDDGYSDTYTLAYPILKKYGLPATVFLTTGFVGAQGLLWIDRVAYCINQARCHAVTLNGTRYPLYTATERRDAITQIIDELKQVTEERKLELLEELQRACGVDVHGRAYTLALSWDEVREMARNGITIGAHTVTHPILTRVPKDIAESEILESKLTIEKEIGQPVHLFAYPNGQPGDFNEATQRLVESLGFEAAFTTIHGRNRFNTDRFALRRLWIGPNDDLPIFEAKLAGVFDVLRPMKRFLGL